MENSSLMQHKFHITTSQQLLLTQFILQTPSILQHFSTLALVFASLHTLVDLQRFNMFVIEIFHFFAEIIFTVFI